MDARTSIVRASIVRASRVRPSIIRASIIRASIIRASVVRASILRASIVRARGLARCLGAAALALSLATPPSLALAHHAAVDEAPLRVNFSIDTSDVGEEGPVIRRRIDERGAVFLRDHDVLPARGDDDPRLIVAVHQDPADPFHYTYSLTLIDARGETRLEARGECPQCTEGALTERVVGELRGAVDRLRALAREDAAAAAATAEPEGPIEPPAPELPEAPPPGRSPQGKAGLGLVIVGALATGGGLGLILYPATPLSDQPTKERYTWPPGIAVLGVGLASAVVGAVLLARDRSRRRSGGSTSTRAGLRSAHAARGASGGAP